MVDLLSALAAVMAFAAAVTILRRTGTAYLRGAFTSVLGFASLLLAHVTPFFILEWYWAVGAIVLGQITGGVVGNMMLLPFLRSPDWPENAALTILCAPVVYFLGSLAISILMLGNKVWI